MKTGDTEDPIEQRQKEIEFAWALVDWRTFDPISPKIAFPGILRWFSTSLGRNESSVSLACKRCNNR
jgi:hypothetical protein